MKVSKSYRPKKSLRTLLMLWFILFSVVPLAFITGYSLVKYEQAIDQELAQRLKSNRREIETILNDFLDALFEKVRRQSSDAKLVYYLAQKNIPAARTLARGWMQNHFAQRMNIYGRDGLMEISFLRDGGGNVKRLKKFEGTMYYMPEEYLKSQKEEMALVYFGAKRNLDLIVFSKIRTSKGRLVGYVEQIIKFETYIGGLKNRLGLELLFFSPEGDKAIASHQDLEVYKKKFFKDVYEDVGDHVFELSVQGVPYGFVIQPVSWGEDQFFMGIGASKQNVRAILRNVNLAFFIVVAMVILLFIVLSFVISKSLLKPVNDLVDAVSSSDLDKAPVEVAITSDTELGLLTASFNEMFGRIYKAQRDLKEKINELETANDEIKDTQAKLVHSAKMASLGQLVAGVAHELNNPIGFIYSNMSHLRDYSEKLVSLVDTAEKEPKNLNKKKSEVEFDYITKDMPKLISSCEEGARRTRDIVLGLRNFSRLEEAKRQEADIHAGIEETLNLLAGELKSKVSVTKDFGKLPKISCYPSQLNQVFMNILSNAAHAIDGKGEITITTIKKDEKYIEISIRDSGRGMDKATAEKIFDPFFTTKSVGKGTGLGMSVTYGIIQKHDGDIRVESEKGKGTEFTITLPIKGST